MPIHDWSRIDAGVFHHFHLMWIAEMSQILNGGILPSGYYAMAEQHAGETIPDVLALHAASASNGIPSPGSETSTITKTRPRVQRKLAARIAPKQKRRTIAVRHVSGHRIIALIEIVSPASKDRLRSVTEFVNKLTAALQLGIHVLLIDLFRPGPNDSAGLHGAVWERFDPDRPYESPETQSLTLAAYAANAPAKAYVNHLSIGDPLPSMPLFLTAKRYVDVPLEPSYMSAYQGMPEFWRDVVEGKKTAL